MGKVKCLIEVYINFTSEFDRGHRTCFLHPQFDIYLHVYLRLFLLLLAA